MLYTKFFAAGVAFVNTISATSCTLKAISDTTLGGFGIDIKDLIVKTVSGWNNYHVNPRPLPELPVQPEPIDFCNVTVIYTHPGLNDNIRATIWLPLERENWNQRFLGQGGGGWDAGHDGSLGFAVAMGMVGMNTDSGHSYFGPLGSTARNSSAWALVSSGNTNLHALQNFGYRTLGEVTQIAKTVTEAYYNSTVRYSYWNGCSTGGRQGLVLAQRYPKLYQGILSAAPAINWVTLLVIEYFAHVKMSQLSYHPPPCEMSVITQAAVDACDDLDGVKDGIVSAHELCDFDAKTVIGHKFDCEGRERTVTMEAAEVANAVWRGPVRAGKTMWPGVSREATLSGKGSMFRGLAATDCDENNLNCRSAPFPTSADWIRNWLLKDNNADLNDIDEEQFYDLLRESQLEYHSLIDSSDPDLTQFQAAGGKLIHWHGLADPLISPNGSLHYYKRVQAMVPNVMEFYRYFEVPGVAHCRGGTGALPYNAIRSLMAWVENGEAPDHLDGESSIGDPGASKTKTLSRPICAWPRVAAYKGGDITRAASFGCADTFDAFITAPDSHDEL